MKLICSAQQLLSKFVDRNSLLDGRVDRFDISSEEGAVSVKVYFHMRSSSDFEKVLFEFVRCKTYGFYYSDDYAFYNVESLKFFKNEEGLFYVSFDPCEEFKDSSDDDQDFILSEDVIAYDLQ